MNNTQDGMLFRSKLHGYSKEDVNAYISSMNANFASLEDGYKSMINHLKLDAEKAAESFNARSADFERRQVLPQPARARTAQGRAAAPEGQGIFCASWFLLNRIYLHYTPNSVNCK